jgi:hypothetical protein
MKDSRGGSEARTPFAMVPLWVYHHPKVTPTVMQVYLALVAKAAVPPFVRRIPKDIADLMAASDLGRTAVYDALVTLREIDAVMESKGRLLLPIDEPSAVADFKSTAVNPKSARADKQSAPADEKSAPADYTSTREVEREKTAGRAQDARPEPKPPSDLIAKTAHRLTVLAFEQGCKPVLRSDGNAFVAVLGIFDKVLRSGRPVNELERAITGGYIDVWTVAGVTTGISKAKPRRSDDQGFEVAEAMWMKYRDEELNSNEQA